MIRCDKSAVQQYCQVWLWLLLWVVFVPGVRAEGIITTVAGRCGMSDDYSGDGGLATDAGMSPSNIAVDEAGNLYVSSDHRIRKVDTDGIISTIAGNGIAGYSGDGGPATLSQFYFPGGIMVDNLGNLYVADTYNHRIRKIDTDGIVTTVAGDGSEGCSGDGGSAVEAQFLKPVDIAIDNLSNLYISSAGCNRIHKVDTHGIITTVAGGNYWADYKTHGDGGTATEASLDWPTDITVDSIGNLYIADSLNNIIRKVDTDGIITTVVGDSAKSLSGDFSGDGNVATSARLSNPTSVAIDSTGNLYIADYVNDRIRKVDANGIITTVAGSGIGEYTYSGKNGDGGPATESNLYGPVDITLDKNGNLYIVENNNHCIRKVAFTSPSPCTYGIIPTSNSHGSNAETGEVNVIVSAADCAWSAVSNVDWVAIYLFEISELGTGTVFYSVTANPSSQSRSGTLTIEDQTFTINQAGQEITRIPDIRIEPTTLVFE